MNSIVLNDLQVVGLRSILNDHFKEILSFQEKVKSTKMETVVSPLIKKLEFLETKTDVYDYQIHHRFKIIQDQTELWMFLVSCNLILDATRRDLTPYKKRELALDDTLPILSEVEKEKRKWGVENGR